MLSHAAQEYPLATAAAAIMVLFIARGEVSSVGRGDDVEVMPVVVVVV